MRSGLCTLSIVPCRREPSGTSEMVTQLLFGEHYKVLGSEGNWIRIRTAYEGYECWINERQHTAIQDHLYKILEAKAPVFAADLVQVIHEKGKRHFPVTLGANLTVCSLGSDNLGFSQEGDVARPNGKVTAKAILETASLYLHAPYLWGGKTPFGIDCSGFTQMVFRMNGIQLPRDAYQQVELGEPLSFVEEALPGDVAYFDNDQGKIVHVGILLDNTMIIHASGSVRVDKFDHYGIHNPEIRGYSHHLRVIKRILHK